MKEPVTRDAINEALANAKALRALIDSVLEKVCQCELDIVPSSLDACNRVSIANAETGEVVVKQIRHQDASFFVFARDTMPELCDRLCAAWVAYSELYDFSVGDGK